MSTTAAAATVDEGYLAALIADAEQLAAQAAPASSANLPDEFWAARQALTHIRRAAHARARSGDAVLAATLARVAALTAPTLRLPDPVGSPGTLDVAVALIGRSGAGKSTSNRVAGELVGITDDGVSEAALGSGEGLIEAYLDNVDEVGDDGKTRRAKRQVRRSMLVHLDEGQALSEMARRSGATLLPTIRSAWVGERLGQANASEERRRHLPAGEYRFALIAGFQTEHAVALLDDAPAGTPQRFLFASAEDPTIPDDAPDWPGPLRWRPPQHGTAPMGLDPTVAREIRSRALARARGEIDIPPLDAHRDLSRLKAAGLLAVLDQRTQISSEDWTLAGLVLDSSDAVRRRIAIAAADRARQAERARTGQHVRQAAAVDHDQHRRALEGMARSIARHVHRHGEKDGCQRSCVTRATAGKHRQHATVDDALDHAEGNRWIARTDDRITPGAERP